MAHTARPSFLSAALVFAVVGACNNATRTLIQIEGATGRYRMTLVEHLRSAYGDENIYPDLKHVMTRP